MSTEPIERECEICGTYFTTTNKLRKYCDNCMKSPESEKRRLSKALHYSRIRTSDPKKIEVTCEKCGREVVTTPSWRITARDKKGLPHDFCCRHCMDKWKEEQARCAYCGGPMLGTGRYNPNNSHPQYCSEKCQEDARWKKAREEGWVHTCVKCGKEFIRKKGGKFCDNTCRRAAMEEGWRPKMAPRKEKKTVITRRETCAFCGKQYTREYRGELPDYHMVFCSRECEEKFQMPMQRKEKGDSGI